MRAASIAEAALASARPRLQHVTQQTAEMSPADVLLRAPRDWRAAQPFRPLRIRSCGVYASTC